VEAVETAVQRGINRRSRVIVLRLRISWVVDLGSVERPTNEMTPDSDLMVTRSFVFPPPIHITLQTSDATDHHLHHDEPV
jgi:hypothetical protein